MKKKLFVCCTMAMAAALLMPTMTSCESFHLQDEQQQEQPAGKAHVKLLFVSASQPSASAKAGAVPVFGAATRASLVANGKQLTDLYILDYNKATGKLLQVLHQTSTSADFAEPELALDYGEHTLKVIATRSTSSTLLDATSAPWTFTDNILTPVSSATEPVVWTSDKTSDSFGAVKDITVAVGQNEVAVIALERLVAKMVVNSTDVFPDDCSTIDAAFSEYRTFNWQTMDVIDPVENQRSSDVSSLAGTTGTTLAYFVLCPKDGYSADITFTMNRKNNPTPYATITVSNVRFERNKITTITGSFYNHSASLSLSIKDEWQQEGNDINI